MLGSGTVQPRARTRGVVSRQKETFPALGALEEVVGLMVCNLEQCPRPSIRGRKLSSERTRMGSKIVESEVGTEARMLPRRACWERVSCAAGFH